MAETIDLKKLERKAYMSVFQDGLLDICAGIYFVLLGIIVTSGTYSIGIISYLLALAIWYAGKKYITTPRMGIVKFSKERKIGTRKDTWMVAGALAIAVLAIIFLWLSSAGMLGSITIPKGMGFVGVGGTMAFLLFMGAAIIRLKRGYAYAALALGVSIASVFTNITPRRLEEGLVFASIGAVMLVVGLVMLRQFLHKYPVPKMEATYG